MLNPDQKKTLDDLLAGLSDAQRAWVANYIGGAAATPQSASNGISLHIHYATETGNTKSVAQNLEKQAKARGFKTSLVPFSRTKPVELAGKNGPVILLSSTHGEGDPPDMGKRFFEALGKPGDVSFKGMKYAVLALGDKSYAKYCHMGVVLDEAIKAGGGEEFHPMAMFDVDYATHVNGWIKEVLTALGGDQPAHIAPAEARVETPTEGPGYARATPIVAAVKDIVDLNDIDSLKETFHIELAYDEELIYAPGDALGIVLPELLGGSKLEPRLYSIASSLLRTPREVHLTVARATYSLPDGTAGYGVCSHYLAQLQPGDHVQCYLQQNRRFKLPIDESRDIIMIGPGTGVAPYRAFVQERAERGASGRNWLLFGDQHAHCDFLYQIEWQEYLENGTLAALDLAFSRDQKKKIYVQDRLREKSAQLLEWIDNGAYVYVCGAKSPMSEDVENTLIELLAVRHNGDKEKAREALDLLAEDDRYVKDVY